MSRAPAIIQTPSPNFGRRRDGATPQLIVLHYTAMARADLALKRLCDPKSQVSAHYLISACGKIHQLVAEAKRAWHAGVGEWGGISDINSLSIGIELDNRGTHPFSEPQMRSLEWLMPGIMQRWDIQPRHVIAHADMAPSRKTDPGPRFDWQRLARQGLSIWPDPDQREATSQSSDWREEAIRFGYPDSPESFVAFRMRFRPWAHHAQDSEDVHILAALNRL